MENYKYSLNDLLDSSNIAADILSEEEVSIIGAKAIDGYRADLGSSEQWRARMSKAFKLAMQLKEVKTEPWLNCSNIKMPLVTIAALQFNALAYPALISSTPVGYHIHGEDKDGEKSRVGKRIASHMNMQLLEESNGSWEQDIDTSLLAQSILGCVFKKTYFDSVYRKNCSELIFPDDLIVNYYTKNLDTCNRISHSIYLDPQTIAERMNAGIYCQHELSPTQIEETQLKQTQARISGRTDGGIDETTPRQVIEQHCLLDLDGDGYKEPYILTVDIATGKVLRLIARFNESNIVRQNNNAKSDIIFIEPIKFFTKYSFIPSPDGGFYDLGLGTILAPINDSVDTIVNQLVDAGSMSVLGGGFLGRGVTIKGGNIRFRPHQWVVTDSPGMALKDNIVPLPVRDPSNVMFELLGLLLTYGDRIFGTNEIRVGENPGQNTPAETMRTMNENGRRVYAAIYKRSWRSMNQELRLWADLNKTYLGVSKTKWQGIIDAGFQDGVFISDYDRVENIFVRPSADPEVSSEEGRRQQAQIVLQTAMTIPGHNMYEVVRRFYDSQRIPNIEEIYPDPRGENAIPPSPPSEKMLALEIKQKELELDTQQQQVDAQLAVLKLQKDAQESAAKVTKLMADAELALREADSIDRGHKIALIESQLSAQKNHQESLLQAISLLLQSIKLKKEMRADEQDRIVGVVGQSSNQRGNGMDEGETVGLNGALG